MEQIDDNCNSGSDNDESEWVGGWVGGLVGWLVGQCFERSQPQRVTPGLNEGEKDEGEKDEGEKDEGEKEGDTPPWMLMVMGGGRRRRRGIA